MLRDISNSVNFDAQEKNYRGSQYPEILPKRRATCFKSTNSVAILYLARVAALFFEFCLKEFGWP